MCILQACRPWPVVELWSAASPLPGFAVHGADLLAGSTGFRQGWMPVPGASLSGTPPRLLTNGGEFLRGRECLLPVLLPRADRGSI